MNFSGMTNSGVAPGIAAYAQPSARALFIRKTYAHLGGAILAFVALEFMLFSVGADQAVLSLLTGSRYSWLIVMGLFMGASMLADNWARSSTSVSTQYCGLGLYVVAEALIFLPLLTIAKMQAPGGELIASAGVVTLFLFGALTAIVFTTKADFSWLRSVLIVCSFIAFGLIVASILFGFHLGLIFSGVMVAFAAGAILYSTSNVLRHYRTDQHVAAALSLFAAVALLFWYVLRIFMSRD